jgi:hypothetical protein
LAKLTRVRTRKKKREVRREILDGGWVARREGRGSWRFYDAYGLHLATEAMKERLARTVLHMLRRQYEAGEKRVRRDILEALGIARIGDRVDSLEQ